MAASQTTPFHVRKRNHDLSVCPRSAARDRIDDRHWLLPIEWVCLSSLGNPSRVILAWVLCGVWAIAGAIGYGALAKRVPLSGGEYLYLTRLMHPFHRFPRGWISLVAGFTVLSPLWPRRLSSMHYRR